MADGKPDSSSNLPQDSKQVHPSIDVMSQSAISKGGSQSLPSHLPTTPPPMPSALNTAFDPGMLKTAFTSLMQNVTVGGKSAEITGSMINFPVSSGSATTGPSVATSVQSAQSPGVQGPPVSASVKDGDARRAAQSQASFDVKDGDARRAAQSQASIDERTSKADRDRKSGASSVNQKTSVSQDYDMRQSAEKAQRAYDASHLTGAAAKEEKRRHHRDLVNRTRGSGSDAERAAARNELMMEGLLADGYVPMLLDRADGGSSSMVYVKQGIALDASQGIPDSNADLDVSAFYSHVHPFKVFGKSTTSVNGESASVAQVGVFANSNLLLSLKPDDDQSITGLLTTASGTATYSPPTLNSDGSAPSNPSFTGSPVTGWVSISGSNQVVYLEITISNGSVTGAEIKADTSFDTSADAWSTGAYVENDGQTPPSQTKARKLLAKVGEDVDGIEQYVFTHLVMQNMCINGQPALYPVPY